MTSCPALLLQQGPQLNGAGQAQQEPDLAWMTPSQREEYARGVDKVTTFPLDGERDSRRCAQPHACTNGHPAPRPRLQASLPRPHPRTPQPMYKQQHQPP